MPYRTRLIPLPGGVTPLVVFLPSELLFPFFLRMFAVGKHIITIVTKEHNLLYHRFIQINNHSL